MKAFNINDTNYCFTDDIFNLLKSIETRNSRSLKSLVGKRVGVIKTCRKRKALLVGYVDIVEEIRYNNVDEFRADYKRHRVQPGSEYDIKEGGVKYGYVLGKPERCEPIDVAAKGIVIRNI